MLNYFVYFVLSMAISLLITPKIIKITNKHKIFDEPNSRKIHKKTISRLGGLAIFLAFIFSFVAFNIFFEKALKLSFNIYLYSIALSLSFLVGFIDDIVNITAPYKLLLQVITAFIASLSGLLIDQVTISKFITIRFGYFSYIFTILWIILFMNAINLIDGLDGLASGIIGLASIFIFIISIITNNIFVSYVSLILLGSIIGFYFYNFPPAKIFMGDGGAYFLGFMYSTIALMGIKKSSVAVLFIIPIVLLIIPLVDIMMVILKRIRGRKSILTADRNHLHHRLLALGFTAKNILFITYFFTIILGVFSILIVLLPKEYAFILFTLVFLIVFFSFSLIYLFEKQFLNSNDNRNRKKIFH